MDDYSDKKAFVTGGTGFIGSHVVERLLDIGFGEVRCLVRNHLKWLEGLPVTKIDGDLYNLDALTAGCRGIDYVFHVAGITGTKSKTNLAEFRRANVQATDEMLSVIQEVAPGIARLVVTSSLAVIGECDQIVADENTPLNPVSFYGISKAEMEASLAEKAGAVPFVIIRPPPVYGPRDSDLFAFFKSVARGFAPVLGSPDVYEVGLVHIDDLVRGMCMAAFSDRTIGKTYFISNREVYSWREIADATSKALGTEHSLVKVAPGLLPFFGGVVELIGAVTGRYFPLDRNKAYEIVHACKACSSDRALKDFGFRDEIGLEEGIQQSIEWYKKEGWL